MTHIKASQKVFEIAPIGMYARTTQGWADMFENTGRFTDRSRRDRFMPPDPFQISRIVHLFDNAATVGFAVFMSLWATMFMEFWKRKQATLAWEWNLADLDYGMVSEDSI
ncbi:uncharacterized protein TNCV_4782081 [Trichonephila clavipes]|nr:uncharacterized protein TNCV_4782081 [Trichonephila clavipes]